MVKLGRKVKVCLVAILVKNCFIRAQSAFARHTCQSPAHFCRYGETVICVALRYDS